MANIGPMELLLLGLLAVLIFGPAKLPEIGRGIGKATREFKESISGTGIQEALDGVGDIRSAMTPTNLAKAAMPDMAASVTDVKETFTDPLGQKKAAEAAEQEKSKPAAAPPPPAASDTPAAPSA
jgi:TatA/E family protein of Tat protein translocase